jgi:ABC-2 type transport system permease protein
MADLASGAPTTMAGTGPLSRLSRKQYAALATMRWRLLTNSVRSVQGAFELGARAVAFLIYAFMGLGLGIGLGAGAYSVASTGKWQFLPALFWVVLLVWQVLPVALASFQEQFDLGMLLRFPVNFGSFYVLNILFGLVDIPAILGGLCCVGIWTGITLARPDQFLWTAFALAVFAVFNVLLVRAVLAWLDRWLAQRRTREIVSGLFLLLMLSLQLLNPALRQENRHGAGNFKPSPGRRNVVHEVPAWAKAARGVLPWLPPGLAADGMRHAAERNVASSAESLGFLGIYILAAGAVLGVRLRSEFSGENLGEAPARKVSVEGDRRWLIDGSGPIAAVIEKELRTIPRSMPLLFALGGPLLTVLIIGTVIRNTASASGRPFLLAFPLCVSYALLGFTQMIYNNLGAEGTGIQMLFLSPTPIRTVLLAKNLFHATLFCLVAVLAGLFATLRLGVPDGALIAATATWLLFALPLNLGAGNILSLTMPYRVNLGRLSRQKGSQASALLSMLIQMTVMGVGVAVIEVCAHMGRMWLATPIFLLLAGAAVFAWMRVLGHSDSLANRNRDELIAKLAKTE